MEKELLETRDRSGLLEGAGGQCCAGGLCNNHTTVLLGGAHSWVGALIKRVVFLRWDIKISFLEGGGS